MKKTSKSFLILFAFLILLMSLSVTSSEWMQGTFVRALSPVWELFRGGSSQPAAFELPKDAQKNELLTLKKPSKDAIPARIIFRSLSSWNSSFWINVGEENNQERWNAKIAKNSPVLIGDSVVGVIDYVGKHQSRVRLITDSGLVPSVRVARGHDQAKAIAENIADLILYFNGHPELFENSQEKTALDTSLKIMQQKLNAKKETWYLAKGELRGQSHPLWRRDAHILRGSGFNYDFEDEFGPARDLRTGEPSLPHKGLKAMPLVKVHDLLITTGMDGVFPPNLRVGIVTKIDLLREGDYAFELEAKPTVGSLDDLSWVYVISPTGFDTTDQP